MYRVIRQAPHNRMIHRENLQDLDKHVWKLAVDIIEKDEIYIMKASIPGVNPEDLEIQYEGDLLSISGEYQIDENLNADDFLIRERRPGKFQRQIRFNTDIDTDQIKAAYENGVLILTLPKAESVIPKKIAVKKS